MKENILLLLIVPLLFGACLGDYPSKSDEIDKGYILEIEESDLEDLDSINLLLEKNKDLLLTEVEKNFPLIFEKLKFHYFTKVLLNKYLPDSTRNKGFLIRQDFSITPEKSSNTKSKLNLSSIEYSFNWNRGIYSLHYPKLIRGDRNSDKPENNFNYRIEQKLLYNFDLDSVISARNNLLYTKKISNNWTYIIEYEKVGDDRLFTPTKEETEMLRAKYFSFIE